jgi:hypothetical protein
LIEQPVGAALSHELYVKGEQVDGDLDNLIERRHHRRVKDEGDRVVEPAWKETERAYQEKRRQRARLEWHAHHVDQASRLRRTLEDLIEHHEQEAEKYGDQPLGAA